MSFQFQPSKRVSRFGDSASSSGDEPILNSPLRTSAAGATRLEELAARRAERDATRKAFYTRTRSTAPLFVSLKYGVDSAAHPPAVEVAPIIEENDSSTPSGTPSRAGLAIKSRSRRPSLRGAFVRIDRQDRAKAAESVVRPLAPKRFIPSPSPPPPVVETENDYSDFSSSDIEMSRSPMIRAMVTTGTIPEHRLYSPEGVVRLTPPRSNSSSESDYNMTLSPMFQESPPGSRSEASKAPIPTHAQENPSDTALKSQISTTQSSRPQVSNMLDDVIDDVPAAVSNQERPSTTPIPRRTSAGQLPPKPVVMTANAPITEPHSAVSRHDHVLSSVSLPTSHTPEYESESPKDADLKTRHDSKQPKRPSSPLTLPTTETSVVPSQTYSEIVTSPRLTTAEITRQLSPTISLRSSLRELSRLSAAEKPIDTDTKSLVNLPVSIDLKSAAHPINTAKPATAASDLAAIVAEMEEEVLVDDKAGASTMNDRLQASLAGIRDAKKGIESVESKVAGVYDAAVGSSTRTIHATKVEESNWIALSVPKLWRKAPGKRWGIEFTRLFWVIAAICLWANVEDYAWSCVGRMDYLAYWEPVDPTRPEWGYAIAWVVRRFVRDTLGIKQKSMYPGRERYPRRMN